MIKINRSGTINKPIDKVWKVLFEEFTKVERWAIRTIDIKIIKK